MRQRLSSAEVAELAELLDDAPRRAGVVEEVLQAASEGRGMTLSLDDPDGPTRSRGARSRTDEPGKSARRR